VFGALLAPLFGERMHRRGWAAAGVDLLGAVIVAATDCKG
jgi:drug/metabolite transporter (DMT)-like permease